MSYLGTKISNLGTKFPTWNPFQDPVKRKKLGDFDDDDRQDQASAPMAH
jgi:hypothetical protein